MDGYAGWLAYITKDNQLLIKKYKVYPDRNYPEIAASTTSIYYFKEEFCEVEPLDDREPETRRRSVVYGTLVFVRLSISG